jgi:SAM-dependent methyltransferase
LTSVLESVLTPKYLDIYHVGPSEEKVRELYLPLLSYFQDCDLVLDVGCGRGILLQMFSEDGITAVGCDSELEMVSECRRKGFNVVQGDALGFLGTTELPIDGICCGHLIEHLTGESALELMRLCFQKLRGGGKFMIVTPNPEDLRVITHYFWLDLTHVRPYPRQLLEEMLQHVGFSIQASHDSVRDSLQDKTGLIKVLGSIMKWVAKRIVGVDILFRGDTVVVARKP